MSTTVERGCPSRGGPARERRRKLRYLPRSSSDGFRLVAVRVGKPNPDLATLPLPVRAAAHVFSNGEVAWPNVDAGHAIIALAASGKRILGLDARTLYPDDGVMEIPISAWREQPGESRGEQIERSRVEALEALAVAAAEGTHVLITWD